jgi:hypothetical protein
MEEFHIPRPKAGEVLIKTKGDYLISWFLIYGIFFMRIHLVFGANVNLLRL